MRATRDAILSLGLKVSLVGASLVQSILLARWMIPEEFGEYTIGLTVCLIAGGAATLGQHVAVLRFWPEYSSTARQALAKGVVIFGYAATVLGSVAVVALFSLAVQVLAGTGVQTFGYLLFAGPLIVAWAFSELLMGLLRAQGKFVWSSAPRDIVWRLSVVAVAGVSVLGGSPLRSEPLLLISAAILLALVLIQSWIVYGAVRRSADVSPKFLPRDWLKSAMRLSLATLVSVAAAQLDTPLIGFLLDPESAARFFVVQRTATLLTIVLSAMNVFYAARFAELFHTGRRVELQNFTAQVSVLIALFALPLFAVVQLAPGPILAIFGTDYAANALELRILSAAYLIDALAGPVGIMLLLCDRELKHVVVLTLSIVLRAALLTAGAKALGLTGAAIGAAAGQVIMIFLLWVAVRRETGIEPSVGGVWGLVRKRRPDPSP